MMADWVVELAAGCLGSGWECEGDLDRSDVDAEGGGYVVLLLYYAVAVAEAGIR